MLGMKEEYGRTVIFFFCPHCYCGVCKRERHDFFFNINLQQETFRPPGAWVILLPVKVVAPPTTFLHFILLPNFSGC
jgi:hypothetical protein